MKKKYLTLVAAIAIGLASAATAFAVPVTHQNYPASMTASVSPAVDTNSVTVSVSGNLGQERNNCTLSAGNENPATDVPLFEPTGQSVSNGSVTIVSGPTGFINQTVPVSVTPGRPANSTTCTNGTTYTFLGNKIFDTTNLPNGTYTLSFSGKTDINEPLTASASFTVSHPVAPTPTLTASCSGNPSNAYVGDGVTWTALPSGGTGTYTYSWSGTDGLTGASKTITKTYSTIGTKTGNVTVFSGTQSKSTTCSVSVLSSAPVNPTISCAVNPTSATIDQSVTWSSNVSDAVSPIVYKWTGTDGLTGNTASVIKAYSATGTKTATVNVTAGNGSATSTCPNLLVTSSSTPVVQAGSIAISSNLSTTWGLTGPSPKTQSTNSSGTTYTNMLGGTYTLVPADIAGYTYTITPAQSQTLTVGGSLSFTITYTGITTSITCAPLSQTKNIGDTVAVSASGGYGVVYDWYAPTATPQSSQTFNPLWNGTYSTAGLKSVTVTRQGVGNATCMVNVLASNTLPSGNHDTSNGSACLVTGWATDPNTTSPINVKIYSDGVLAKTALANKYRSDLSGVCTGSSCSFSESLSGFISNGAAHSITIKAVDAQTAQEVNLWNTPKSMTCSATVGSVTVSSNVPTTWTLTGPTPQSQVTNASNATYGGMTPGVYSLSVPNLTGYLPPSVAVASSQTLSAGGTLTFSITYATDPNGPGGGGGGGGAGGGGASTIACSPFSQTAILNQVMGFGVSGGPSGSTTSWVAQNGHPASATGSSTFSTYFTSGGLKTVSVTKGAEMGLCYASVSVTGNDTPTGSHDTNTGAYCQIDGWAADPDDLNQDLAVKIYSDGVLAKTVTANNYRSDLTGSCVQGTCSFSTSLSGLISAGVAHSITAKAVDAQTGTETTLPNSPKSITCAVAPSDFSLSGTGSMKIRSAAGGAQSSASTIKVLASGSPVWSSTVALSAYSPDSRLTGSQFIFGDASLTSAEYSVGSTLIVQLPNVVPTGIYPVVITGTSNGVTRSVTLNLTVTGGAPSFNEF